ncbi:Hypothetical predicted protein [Xyrichtys novacula]|nr:Hypothetical predicted protein [Xyrichtys novacula]
MAVTYYNCSGGGGGGGLQQLLAWRGVMKKDCQCSQSLKNGTGDGGISVQPAANRLVCNDPA